MISSISRAFGRVQPPPPSRPHRSDEPVDVVTATPVDPAARARRMWPELARHASLATASGPIGAALTHTLREDLLSLFTSLDARGVRFLGPSALTPEAAVRTLESHGAQSLSVAGEGRGVLPLDSLQDLQALDAIHLSGDAAGLEEHPRIARVLKGLDDGGFQVFHTTRNGLTWEPVDPLAAWRFAARHPGERDAIRAIRIETASGSPLLHETDDHPEARNMFAVLGSVDGGPAFYAGVRRLVDRGYEIGHVDFPLRGPYGSGEMVTLYTPEAVTFPVPVADLGDADRIERLVAAQVLAQAEYLKPHIAGGRLGSSETRAFAEGVLYACPELGTDEAAATLARLIQGMGGPSAQTVKEAGRILHEVRERTRRADGLRDNTEQVLSLLTAPQLKDTPWKERLDLGLALLDRAEREAGRVDFPARRDGFRDLLLGCRSAQQADAVYAAIEGAEGCETFAERMSAYRRIAAGDDALVPAEVASVFGGRLADESLADSADRFAALREALGRHGQAGQARRVHESLRRLVRECDVPLVKAQQTFLQAMLYARDASTALARTTELLAPGREDLTIENGARSVAIGGIRVPKRAV